MLASFINDPNSSNSPMHSDDWCTPPEILELVRKVFKGPIGLDPCWNPQSITHPLHHFTKETDGLKQKWDSTRIYVNPPYSSPNLALWTKKCASEAPIGTLKRIIALVPASVDTGWWHNNVVPSARAVCFWRGRLKFIGDKTYPARFSSALVYWGYEPISFCDIMAPHGWVVPLWKHW